MGEQVQIIVTPIGGEHTSGAVVITADCGHRAWISMGGIESQAKMGATTICMACVDPSDVPELVVTPEIYRDLVEAVGMKEADHLIALSKDPKMRARMFAHYGRKPA